MDGAVLGWCARRRGEVSTQMCSEAVEKVSSSLCELRDRMQAVCMQGPSCLDCRRPRATGWGGCPVNGAEVQADQRWVDLEILTNKRGRRNRGRRVKNTQNSCKRRGGQGRGRNRAAVQSPV